MLERKNIIVRPSPVLNCANVALNFGNMFIIGDDIELYLEVGNVTLERLELAVAKDEFHLEATSAVETHNGGDVLY